MVNLRPISLDPTSINSSRQWSLNQDIPVEVDNALCESIARLSIIHPPIVRKSSKTYEIISGTRRIAIAKQLSPVNQIVCMVLDDHVNDSDLLTIIATEQKLSGPLSPIQTARLIAIAEAEASTLQHDSEFITLLSGVQSRGKRQQLTRLLALEKTILTSIHAGKCSVQTGLFLLESTKKDRSLIFRVFSNLSLNANKQRRVIELSRIIAAKRQCSIANIFETDYPELLNKPIDNIPQKTAFLLKDLYRLSHPLSSRAEETFNERVKKLKLPNHCRITHSQSFEQDTVTLEIDFSRFDDLEGRWDEMKHQLR